MSFVCSEQDRLQRVSIRSWQTDSDQHGLYMLKDQNVTVSTNSALLLGKVQMKVQSDVITGWAKLDA